ncbi:MAG: hypothetical protein K2P01_03380 [Oscillospiraceae bacterium]|nr:hypothetical protein [Oscillospiraceae bacterium]
MNRIIPRIGAMIVTVSVFLFAVCLIANFPFGSYFVCMFLPIGYIMMAAGLHDESCENRRVAANTGMAFAVVYAVLIFLVYFAQTTSVRQGGLSEQAQGLLDFQRGGLMFNYDLLGYGMMALSTFFMGLSVQADGKADKWMKALLMIHGGFFFGCFTMPMTGVFASMSDGKTNIAGTAALVAWCAYFLPIGMLAYRHFGKKS